MGKKIILDTDLGSDCDDAGALSVLHNLADRGNAEILAITHCASAISGAVTVKAINEWYGRENIPVGRYDRRVFLEDENCLIYTRRIMEKYLESHAMPKFENAVRIQRKALAKNKGITMVVIGMLNNIAELLESEPDDISPLCGIDLVKNSVDEMYIMGGNFADLTYAEWNIRHDIKSAQYVAENFPKSIIYCGIELGNEVITGSKLIDQNENNPVRESYYILRKAHFGDENILRQSWDQITVYCAVKSENILYRKSEKMKIGFDDDGKVLLSKGEKDCYLITNASNEIITHTIDELLY